MRSNQEAQNARIYHAYKWDPVLNQEKEWDEEGLDGFWEEEPMPVSHVPIFLHIGQRHYEWMQADNVLEKPEGFLALVRGFYVSAVSWSKKGAKSYFKAIG